MTSDAKTIQIYLPTGEARGIRIAEITTRLVQAVAIPRSDWTMAKARPELDAIALYFLFGEQEGAAKPIVYIGQTEDIRKRVDQHDAKKEFWQTVVVVVSRSQSFMQQHIRYLEWLSIEQANEAGRFQVENGNAGSKPYVTEPIEADLRDIFPTVGVLVAALGFPLFDPVTRAKVDMERFFLRGKDAEATGELVEDGFVVHAGSLGRVDVVPSAAEQVASMRRPLLDSGVIVQENGRIRFTQDYLFRTPSGAAVTVLGRSANGWVEWKNQSGETLHDTRREQAEE